MAIRRNKFIASVPMSSMADIAFLLLVFFMVTSVLKVDADIPLDLPDASGRELKDDDLMVSIAKSGAYWVGNIPLQRAEAIARIRAKVQLNPEIRINIQAHRDLDFSVVQSLLDSLQDAGVTRFAMITRQENRQM